MMPTSDAPRCLATRLMCSAITLGSATSVRTGFIRPRGAPAMCDSIALRRSADVLAVAIRPSGSREVRLKYQLCSGLPSSPRLFFSWGVCEASTERQSPTTIGGRLRPRYGIGSHGLGRRLPRSASSSFVTIGDLPVRVRVTRDTIQGGRDPDKLLGPPGCSYRRPDRERKAPDGPECAGLSQGHSPGLGRFPLSQDTQAPILRFTPILAFPHQGGRDQAQDQAPSPTAPQELGGRQALTRDAATPGRGSCLRRNDGLPRPVGSPLS